MAIEMNEIEHVALLARIRLDDGDRGELQQRLGNILAMVDQLQAVDTDGVEPLANPLEATQRLRPDEVTEIDQRDALLVLAPATEQGLFLVPKVIDAAE